jgi:hypothetical protein
MPPGGDPNKVGVRPEKLLKFLLLSYWDPSTMSMAFNCHLDGFGDSPAMK